MDDSLLESYRYAGAIARRRAKNFYYTFWFLPAERRRSIYAVYAFSRRADDAVDSVEERGSTEKEAREQLDRLRSLFGSHPPSDPLVPALLDTILRFSLPTELFEELLAGMEMDLTRKSYETFDDLLTYCYRAASVIGLLSIEIFGYEGAGAREPAIQLGYAMQLTNILRDVDEDLKRGRVYLPKEDLQRFKYSLDDLARRIVDDRFRDLMRFQVARARGYFEAATPLYPLVRPESRYCPLLLMRFYSRILDRMERQGYDVFRKRPSLPWHEKLLIAGAAWLQSSRRRAISSSLWPFRPTSL